MYEKNCSRPMYCPTKNGVHLPSIAAGGVESIPAGLSTPASPAPAPPRILVALDLIALATSSGVAAGYFSR